MFVGYSSEGATEDFSFVTFVELTANTQIRFSDRPWTGSAFDTSNTAADGEVAWTNGSTVISPGSVIIISVTADPNPIASSASIGTTTGNFSTTGLSTGGEIIFAYQGTTTVPSFIHALNYRGLYDTPSTGDTLDSLLPASLNTTNGNVIVSSGIDNGEFSIRNNQNNLLAYKALISTPSNWTTSDTEFPLSATAFSVVPEPSSFLLFGAAALFSLGRKRRR